MNILESARMEEAQLCYAIISSARKFQQEQGFTQWTEEYPNLDIIQNDIKNSKGYVVKTDGEISGYMCIGFDGEPDYEKIDGKWSAEEPYAVIHRMGFAERFRGIGLADITFRLIEKLCMEKGVYYIRVDTDFPNKRMQHILTKNGFVNCGTVAFRGNGRLAYDKRF